MFYYNIFITGAYFYNGGGVSEGVLGAYFSNGGGVSDGVLGAYFSNGGGVSDGVFGVKFLPSKFETFDFSIELIVIYILRHIFKLLFNFLIIYNLKILDDCFI